MNPTRLLCLPFLIFSLYACNKPESTGDKLHEGQLKALEKARETESHMKQQADDLKQQLENQYR